MSKSRGMQNSAALLGAGLIALMVASPWALANAAEWKSSAGAQDATTDVVTLDSVTEIAGMKYVFTNKTDVKQVIDLCPTAHLKQPNGTARTDGDIGARCALIYDGTLPAVIEVGKVDTMTVSVTYVTAADIGNGVQTDGIKFSVDVSNSSFNNATGKWGALAANTAVDAYLEITLANATAQKFLATSTSAFRYALNPLGSGDHCTADVPDCTGTNLHAVNHASTDKDFSIVSGYVYGGVKIFDSGKVDMADGTKVGSNYTRSGMIHLLDLAHAKNDGTDSGKLAPESDNQVTVQVHGVYPDADDGALLGDEVSFTVQYVRPNTVTATSYMDTVGFFGGIFGVGLFVLGALASPWWSLRDLDRFDRRAGKFGGN